MRVGATPMSRAAVVAMSLLALPWIAFFVAGGQFGAPASNLAWAPVILYGPTTPGGSDLGTGFTTVRLAATGQTTPSSIACSNSGHCLALGVPWDIPTATSYGAIYSTSSGPWHVAPFRITRAQSLTVPFAQNRLVCPGSRTCYELSTNAAELPELASSTDGGLHWQAVDLPFKQIQPPNAYSVIGLQAACMTEKACVFAVPQGFAVTLDGGSSWVHNDSLFLVARTGRSARPGRIEQLSRRSGLSLCSGLLCRGRDRGKVAGVRVICHMAVLDSRCRSNVDTASNWPAHGPGDRPKSAHVYGRQLRLCGRGALCARRSCR
jgi:hypothetical protein